MSLLHVSYNQIGIESVGWGESVEIAIGFLWIVGGALGLCGFSGRCARTPLFTTTCACSVAIASNVVGTC